MSEDVLYFIFLLIVFIVSLINKALKQKKTPPPRPTKKVSQTPSKVEKPGSARDIFARELSELLGIPEQQGKTEIQTKKIQPKIQPKPDSPSIASESQQRDDVFAKSAFSSSQPVSKVEKKIPLTDMETKKKREVIHDDEVTTKLFQERLIWAEILGLPKALRHRHRII